MSSLPPSASASSSSSASASASATGPASTGRPNGMPNGLNNGLTNGLPNGVRLDARTQALLRLHASRERIQRSMRPGDEGPILHWLEHPFRFVRRWWRNIAPILMAGGWMRSAATAAGAAGADAAAAGAAAGAAGHAAAANLHEAGEAVISSARVWVREHPVASVSAAALLGALLIGKRGVLWGLLLGVGQGVARQGQGWLLRRLADPAIYMAFFAAMAAKSADAPGAPGAPDQPPQDQEDQAA